MGAPAPVMLTTLRPALLIALVLADRQRRRAPKTATDPEVASAITDILVRPDPLVVDGVTLSGTLRALYEGTSASPLWQGHVDAVTKVLADAATEGLDPAAYHLTAIAARARAESPAEVGTLDLLVSDAVLRYAYDVRFGRMRPLHVTAEVALATPVDHVPLVRAIAATPDPAAAMRICRSTRPTAGCATRWRRTVPRSPTASDGRSFPMGPLFVREATTRRCRRCARDSKRVASSFTTTRRRRTTTVPRWSKR